LLLLLLLWLLVCFGIGLTVLLLLCCVAKNSRHFVVIV
jgi:hypothetical protein